MVFINITLGYIVIMVIKCYYCVLKLMFRVVVVYSGNYEPKVHVNSKTIIVPKMFVEITNNAIMKKIIT